MLKKSVSVLAITSSLLATSLLATEGATAGAAEGDAIVQETTTTTALTTTTLIESSGISELIPVPNPVATITTIAAETTTTIAVATTTTTVAPENDAAADAYLHQAGRLYRATLGREPDAGGQSFWADRLREGYPLEEVARFMLASDEAQQSTGDVIVDAYNWALGRDPEESGYAYWVSFDDPAIAVAAVSDSVEHQNITGTLPPPSRVDPPAGAGQAGAASEYPVGWENAGNGVWVPRILLDIRFCESGHSYTAKNSRSTASGAYQFLNSSWAAYGHAARYGVSRAMDATPAQQDEAAVITWERDGVRPWYASRHCWS